jgi:hypothetical protein
MSIRIKDQDLRLRTSGRFYRLYSRISRPKIKAIFSEIHASHKSDDPQIQHRIHAFGVNTAIVDYTVIPYEEEPSFLEGTSIREQRFGLIMLVQYRGYACVSLAGRISFSDSNVELIARRVEHDAIADLLSDAEQIERVSYRNMSLAPGGIRARTIEADDLRTTLPPLGLNRQILTAVRARHANTSRSARPSTGHITKVSPRATFQRYVAWVAEEIDRIHLRSAVLSGSPTVGSRFLQYFAQRVKRRDLPLGVRPTAVYLDLARLEQGIADGEFAVFLVNSANRQATPTRIPDELAHAVIQVLREPGIVQPHTGDISTVLFDGFVAEFSLRANKQSYSLSSPSLRDVRIGHGVGSNLQTINEWLREHSALFISMTDARFTFANGSLFRDERIAAQAPALLSCLHACHVLSQCTSEKDDMSLTQQSTTFSANSVFGAVETTIAAADGLLICDDLADEWADYIGIDETTNTITLYHAKHGTPTTGASTFQVVVGQALKNLGRLSAIREDLETKKDVWSRTYQTLNITTCIERVRRGGDVDSFITAYENVSSQTARRTRVALVVSFVSKLELEETVERMRIQADLRPHEQQRVWLLASFVNACREIGAEALIFCRP